MLPPWSERGYKEDGAGLLEPGDMMWYDVKQRTQVRTQEILIRYWKNVLPWSGQILEQFVQRGCGASIFGSVQDWTGHSPEQPVLNRPALTRALGQMTSRCLPTSMILRIYDAVNRWCCILESSLNWSEKWSLPLGGGVSHAKRGHGKAWKKTPSCSLPCGHHTGLR